jgi:hypothetical protein
LNLLGEVKEEADGSQGKYNHNHCVSKD